MRKSNHTAKTILISLGLLTGFSSIFAQKTLDPEEERTAIEIRDALYSQYLLQGDSVAIANMYTSDGSIGCETGPEILAAAGSWIRSGIKNDSRHVLFKTVTLNADGEMLIETGIIEGRSDAGVLKYSGKYLVVWKKEDGVWKLFRDVVL